MSVFAKQRRRHRLHVSLNSKTRRGSILKNDVEKSRRMSKAHFHGNANCQTQGPIARPTVRHNQSQPPMARPSRQSIARHTVNRKAHCQSQPTVIARPTVNRKAQSQVNRNPLWQDPSRQSTARLQTNRKAKCQPQSIATTSGKTQVDSQPQDCEPIARHTVCRHNHCGKCPLSIARHTVNRKAHCHRGPGTAINRKAPCHCNANCSSQPPVASQYHDRSRSMA
jgi:hypothetical protein